MGLDMYLTKKTYVKQWGHQLPEETYEVEVTKGGVRCSNIKPERITNIEEEIGYWRKANQIHRWFVQNVQNGNDDCGEYYVGKGHLESLLDLCKKVQADNSLASALLPSASGFFFGGEDYDEWYFNGIDNTISILEEALSDKNDGSYYYSSSW
jgi:hypothetical protein